MTTEGTPEAVKAELAVRPFVVAQRADGQWEIYNEFTGRLMSLAGPFPTLHEAVTDAMRLNDQWQAANPAGQPYYQSAPWPKEKRKRFTTGAYPAIYRFRRSLAVAWFAFKAEWRFWG